MKGEGEGEGEELLQADVLWARWAGGPWLSSLCWLPPLMHGCCFLLPFCTLTF